MAKLCRSSILQRLREISLGKETGGSATLLLFFPHWNPTMECIGQQYQAVEHSHLQYLEVEERSHCWQNKVIHLALEYNLRLETLREKLQWGLGQQSTNLSIMSWTMSGQFVKGCLIPSTIMGMKSTGKHWCRLHLGTPMSLSAEMGTRNKPWNKFSAILVLTYMRKETMARRSAWF